MKKNELENYLFQGMNRNFFRIIKLSSIILIACLVQVIAVDYAQAQQQTISGKVTDVSGQPMPGVSVIVKGTTQGTITNTDGNYTLSNAPEGAILNFTFVGMLSQEVVVGNQTTINITLKEEAIGLDEVVVTALGIQKESKSLGYATSKVNSDQLTVNRTPNLMNALTGKIAGVSISSLGTGPNGTSKIRIRGQSSISGQNNPLIVVNGVPIDNTNFGTNPNNAGSDSSIGVQIGRASCRERV